MKISKEQLEKIRDGKTQELPAEIRTIVEKESLVIDNTDKGFAESVNSLIDVINKKNFSGAEEVSRAIQAVVQDSDQKYVGLVKYIGDKIEAAAAVMSRRPDAFEFDVKRNHNGFIDKILVKPVRE